MEKLKSYFPKVIIALFLFSVVALPTYSQNKEDTKEAKEQLMKENREAILSLLQDQHFVLTADRLMDRKLNTYMVNSGTNFVKIDGDDVVIQFGFDHAIGWNGVGGLTVEGKLKELKISGDDDDDQPLNAIANISTRGYGFMTLQMTAFNNGSAQASLSGNFGSRLKFLGDFQPVENAGIYKGMALY